MPSGKVHDAITVISFPIVAAGVYYLTQNPMTTAEISIPFLFSGLMFAGDLDIRSNETRRWKSLRFIWIPYQKMFKHRSFFTHNFLVGTIVRILYVYAWFLLFYGLYFYFFNQELIDIEHITLSIWSILEKNKSIFINVLLGLFLGSFSHSAADSIVSKIKRLRRKRKKNKRK